MNDQAENLRILMENKNKPDSINVITVTSAKGGVGKSSVALNFAIAMAKRGKRVLLVDMDFGLANIDVMLGVKPKYDLMNVIHDHMDIRNVVEEGLFGVKFVSGGSGVYELASMNLVQLNNVIRNLSRMDDIADTLIFDTGAGVNENIVRLVCASNDTFLVTNPEPTAIMDAYTLVKIVSRQEVKPHIRLVINKAEDEKEAMAAMTGFIRIAEKYTDMTIDELGYILRDDNMIKAVKAQVPLLVGAPRCTAAANIEKLTNRYLMTPDQQKPGLGGFWERLLGKRLLFREL
jgi:flagellar biosynthesis protein FlhG